MNRRLYYSVLALAGTVMSASHAARLQDTQYYSYDVRFTNPECAEYRYPSPGVKSESGDLLRAKPKNAYCSNRPASQNPAGDGKSDAQRSGARPTSVQYKLLEWINDKDTKEIFMTYLSFSNSAVTRALCDAVKKRGVKVTINIDTTSDTSKVQEIASCAPSNMPFSARPRILQRGHVDGIDYAHNKLIIINPNTNGKIGLVFSSGNMSSGAVLHHENWHFVTTTVRSFFAQKHLCLMNATLSDEATSSASAYAQYIANCKKKIPYPEETDIKTYFVPGEGGTDSKGASKKVFDQIAKSKDIAVAAHRFSYGALLKNLTTHVKKPGRTLRLVTDDDTYWVGTHGQQVGDNLPSEYTNVEKLVKAGMEVKWMETNHADHLLHHNKYLVFDDKAVFTGAGNLTTSAFYSNFENFYFIEIPSVVKAFNEQYEKVWNTLATSPEDMPTQMTQP